MNKDIHIRKRLDKLLRSRNIQVRITKRHRRDILTRITGRCSVIMCLLFLVYIIFNICGNCYYAIISTEVLVPVHITETNVDNIRARISDGIKRVLPDQSTENIISGSAAWKISNLVEDHIDYLGQDRELWLTASSELNTTFQHKKHSGIVDKLKDLGRIRTTFNTNLFTHADSQYPEYAGILGAIVGSLFTISICFVCILPIGILTGISLQEFKFKNKILASIIETSINNLSATPAIIFGIVGLYVYISVLGIPRSSALVGGLVLSLMMLPILVISTRQALSNVPNNIKEAALALGASKIQVVLHHTLPLAFPGIITGSILGIARVLGESAPLLMIGMAAFVADIPRNFLEPTTVFPLQIYLWASNADNTFHELNSVLILILLIVLLILNIVATVIRKKMHIVTHN